MEEEYNLRVFYHKKDPNVNWELLIDDIISLCTTFLLNRDTNEFKHNELVLLPSHRSYIPQRVIISSILHNLRRKINITSKSKEHITTTVNTLNETGVSIIRHRTFR